jgi:O-antigen/teichoic acid export membrane protein
MMIKKIAQSLPMGNVLKGSAAAFAIKLAASIAGFAMFALSSRYMEPASFGSLAIIFNAMSFLSVVALCGQETLIIRSWDEYRGSDRPALARGALVFGVQVVGCATLGMAAIVALAWPAWDRTVSTPLVLAACAFLLAFSFMQFSGQFTRVAAGVIIAEIPRELMWRLIVVAAIAVHHAMSTDFDATDFFFASAGALVVALAFQIYRVARVIPAAVKRSASQRDVGAWAPRSFKMWLSVLLDTTSQYLEVVAIGFFLGPAPAGFYFVVTRITNVFSMIAGSVSIYAMRHISNLFYADAKEELQGMLRSLAIIGAILIGGAFLVIVVAGKLLLWAFGAAYVSAYPALLILAVGASIGAMVGPAAHVLLLTGHEGAYPRIVASALVIRFVLIAVLGPMLGLIGAVLAWSISAIILAVALIVACRRLVGLDPSLSFALAPRRQRMVPLRGGSS